MKKILIVLALFLFFGCISGVSAANTVDSGFVALAPIPGLTDDTTTSVVNSASLAVFFNNLYKYLIGLAAVLATLQIIWAGIKMAYFNKDSANAIKKSREAIQQAILGLILVLLPVLVFSIINPNILNLSLNLPALNKLAETTTSTQIQSNVTGCTTTTGSAPGTVIATCIAPDENTAQSEAGDFLSKNCAGDSNVGAMVSSSCPKNTVEINQGVSGGNKTKICTQATAVVYCSPVVTANIVQQITVKTDVGFGGRVSATISYKDLGYFGDTAFVATCAGGDWTLDRVGGTTVSFGSVTTQQEGTKIDCPTDQSFLNVLDNLKAGKSYECVSVPVYCRYKP